MAAIYMWFEAGIEFLTTTLYPIEIIDGVQLGANISIECSMSPIIQDDLNVAGTVLGVVVNTILLETGPSQDELNVAGTVVEVVVNQILISYGPDEDQIDVAGEVLNVILDVRKVVVDTPVEKLQLSIDVVPSGSTMTHV